MRRWILAVAIVAVVGAVFGLRHVRGNSDRGAPKYEFAQAVKKPMWMRVSATGLVEPVLEVEVKSKASGVVVDLPVEEGDSVRRGQIIARLDPAEITNELERERASLVVASQSVRVQEEERRRAEELFREGLVSTRDLEMAKLELERARAEETGRRLAVANLEEKLNDTVLRSPIDGLILDKRVEIGQVISSGVSNYTGGTAIAVVADMSKVYVKADVDETDIGEVETGMRVEATPDAFPDLKFDGAVERISPRSKIAQNVTTFEVVAAVDNSAGLLKAGMNVTAEIMIAGKDEALVVPRRAVRTAAEVPELAEQLGVRSAGRPGEEKGGRAVFVSTADGLVAREVSVGLWDWNEVEITAGLSEGDRVVAFVTSRALDQGKEEMERRRSMAMPGFRRTTR